MRIHLSGNRAHRSRYYEDYSVREILQAFFVDHDAPITVGEVLFNDDSLFSQGHVRLCFAGNIDDLLHAAMSGHDLSEPRFCIEQIVEASSDELVVIPVVEASSGARIDKETARQLIAYDTQHLLKLDSSLVKEVLGLSKRPYGPLSKKKKIVHTVSPEKALIALFDGLHSNMDIEMQTPHTCYSWFGSDAHRRVVPFLRCIEGAEMRAMQCLAAYKLLIPQYIKELHLGKTAASRFHNPLTDIQQQRRVEKIREYQAYVLRHGLNSILPHLDLRFADLIEIVRHFRHYTGAHLRAPQRETRDGRYQIELTGIPLVKDGDPIAYYMAWELREHSLSPNLLFRAHRRGEPYRGQSDESFSAQGVACVHTLRKKHSKQGTVRMPIQPFVIPTQFMIDIADKLRYQTILLVFNPETRRFSKRPLNHTEIEHQIVNTLIYYGFSSCFSTDINAMAQHGYDPTCELIRFVR